MGSNSPQQIVLTHGCAPGDIVCLTALPRDIATTYPGEFEVHVATHWRSLWANNPHVAGVHASQKPPKGMREVRLNYGRYIPEANKKKLHFLTAFHRDFKKRCGREVPVLHAKGDLHLDHRQRHTRPIEGRYWAIFPGHKEDVTVKGWSIVRWQQLVYKLRDAGINLVQCGSEARAHTNPHLDGVLSVVGETDLRDMLWVLYHADGVICSITAAMHMAAVFDKPCVCIAGGREHWWWEAYVNVAGVETFGPYSQPVTVPHRYLHTQGLLDCCATKGCWKNKARRIQGDRHKSYCKMPSDDGYGQIIPKCMGMVTVEHITEAVMSYYDGSVLPPIGEPDKLVIPKADPPPKRAMAPLQIDLFAPAAEIIAAASKTPKEATVPQLVEAFAGAQKRKVDGPGMITEDPFDHPTIGGSLAICALLYGGYVDMHKACIGSILRTTAPHRRQLRIVTNQLCADTRKWLDTLKDEGHIHTLIHNRDNIKKYPAMRQLFCDPDNPIDTKWLVWFDDDSIANRDDSWCTKLAHKIIAEQPKRARMIGDLRVWTLNHSQLAWAKSRPWWRGRNLQTGQHNEAPNGNKIFFAAGGFWAAELAAMRTANIPDTEIRHNGGDYMLGLQLWQQGFRTASWNKNKKYVFTSSVPRRGANEVHTGMSSWTPNRNIDVTKKR